MFQIRVRFSVDNTDLVVPVFEYVNSGDVVLVSRSEIGQLFCQVTGRIDLKLRTKLVVFET